MLGAYLGWQLLAVLCSIAFLIEGDKTHWSWWNVMSLYVFATAAAYKKSHWVYHGVATFMLITFFGVVLMSFIVRSACIFLLYASTLTPSLSPRDAPYSKTRCAWALFITQ